MPFTAFPKSPEESFWMSSHVTNVKPCSKAKRVTSGSLESTWGRRSQSYTMATQRISDVHDTSTGLQSSTRLEEPKLVSRWSIHRLSVIRSHQGKYDLVHAIEFTLRSHSSKLESCSLSTVLRAGSVDFLKLNVKRKCVGQRVPMRVLRAINTYYQLRGRLFRPKSPKVVHARRPRQQAGSALHGSWEGLCGGAMVNRPFLHP